MIRTIAIASFLLMTSCNFLGPVDFVAEGYTQLELKSRIAGLYRVKVSENIEVLQCYSGGGKDSILWIQLQVPPDQIEAFVQLINEAGYELPSPEENEAFDEFIKFTGQVIPNWWYRSRAPDLISFKSAPSPQTRLKEEGLWLFIDPATGQVWGADISF